MLGIMSAMLEEIDLLFTEARQKRILKACEDADNKRVMFFARLWHLSGFDLCRRQTQINP